MEGTGGVGAGVTSLTMDCEDMFKEITKKLYGEETTVSAGGASCTGGAGGAGGGIGGVVGVEFPAAERDLEDELRPEEHITAWGLAALMQNGFPPPGILQANFGPRLDPLAEDRWTWADEPLAWARSRVAAYNGAQRLFKCCECECVGFLARVAEHWLGRHSAARVFHCPAPACAYASAWARAVRLHLQRDHRSDPAHAEQLLRDNPALDDVTRYLQRLKHKVEAARTERRDVADAATGADVSPPEAATPTGAPDAGKRYACAACPYATDRRDLFTRHENIHRDEKPFHCYLCQKQFNRADHVKKHFLRMHRDQPYDLNRIRRPSGKHLVAPAPSAAPALSYYSKPPAEPPPAPVPTAAPPPLTSHPPHTTPTLEFRATAVKLERSPLTKAESPAPAGQGTHKTGAGTARRKGERRYACCYCAWSGVDNWCLKRHLNTHLKPFACALCEYKAARAERLATHVHKVHNKKACAKCPFLADDHIHLAHHLRDAHHIESRNLKVPSGVGRVGVSTGVGGFASASPQQQGVSEGVGIVGGAARRREHRAAVGGAARLFGYLEASDGSGDEYETPLPPEYSAPQATAPPSATSQSGVQAPPAAAPVPPPAQQYTRDKENAAPMHHTLHHDHCLRY